MPKNQLATYIQTPSQCTLKNSLIIQNQYTSKETQYKEIHSVLTYLYYFSNHYFDGYKENKTYIYSTFITLTKLQLQSQTI